MKLLFVCLGNICRSPTAQAVFEKKLSEQNIQASLDSAGTAAYHVGDPPDPRSIRIAAQRGYPLNHRGRQLSPADLQNFDRIFVMDRSNLEAVRDLARTAQERDKVALITDLIADELKNEVPDPYHGTEADFHLVIDLLEEAAESFIREITSTNTRTPYEALGGEATLRRVVDIFYQKMALLPEVQTIRQMHPQDLSTSAEKLFLFLSGWLGGPPLFVEKYGHPRLRARHLPFAIGKKERDQWMLCMVHAFDEVKIQEPLRSELLHSLLRLADHMRNTQE
jgi:hemoglobin